MKLQLGRAQALLCCGAREAARAALLETAALAQACGDDALRVSAAALFASSRESGSVDETQVRLLEDALASVPVADPRRCWLQALLAKSLSYAPDATRRVQLARQARACALEHPDSALQLETLTRCHQALPGPTTCTSVRRSQPACSSSPAHAATRMRSRQRLLRASRPCRYRRHRWPGRSRVELGDPG